MKKVGICGDLHGRIPEKLMRDIELSQPDFILQVGDYWHYQTDWPVPVYWITGNHENLMQTMSKTPQNNFMLESGLHSIEGINIVALPSIPMPGNDPGPVFFEEEDYEKCMAIEEHVDIFMSHGCGYPFIVSVFGDFIQVEDKRITELINKLQPVYAISGHNHEYQRDIQNGIQLIRLGINYDVYDMLFI